MDYELSVQSECARVGPPPPCLTDSAEPHTFQISFLIPYVSSPKANEIVEILAENGYDVSKIGRLGQHKIIPTPIWAKLNFSMATVRLLFEKYTMPIKWFEKSSNGQTST